MYGESAWADKVVTRASFESVSLVQGEGRNTGLLRRADQIPVDCCEALHQDQLPLEVDAGNVGASLYSFVQVKVLTMARQAWRRNVPFFSNPFSRVHLDNLFVYPYIVFSQPRSLFGAMSRTTGMARSTRKEGGGKNRNTLISKRTSCETRWAKRNAPTFLGPAEGE